MSNIEIIIPTKDEAKNLPYALASVMEWADRVWVVDSESSDDTRAIAEDAGATVVVQPWLGHAKQKNWAIQNLDIKADWVFILDADEAILPELRDELLAIASRPLETVEESAFNINRYFIFLGKRIRHCGYYPSWNVRFFKLGKALYEEREVHEHMVVDGNTGTLKGHMEHYDRRGLEVYMAKHNRYSTLEAKEILMQLEKKDETIDASLWGTAQQRRRWMKQHIYPKLPAKWLCRFFWMYILRLGFLDGLTGLRFCLFISSYELLISLKMIELKQEGEMHGS
ncbi:MAG: glycosyltransferase family 2 protein [Phycisphaerales bacterium]|nr:glycosyltransferase family 2 protein [Phycisphaerales bacterium]